MTDRKMFLSCSVRPELPYMDVGHGDHVWNIERPVEGI